MSIVKTNKWKDFNGNLNNNIVQVVQFDYNVQETFTGTDGTAHTTGLFTSITPIYENSKIIVTASVACAWSQNQSVCRMRIMRTVDNSGSSSFVAYSPSGNVTGSYSDWTNVQYCDTSAAVAMAPNCEMVWVDTPGVTKNIQYRVQLMGNGAYTIGLNRYTYGAAWSGVSHITILEVTQ